MRTRKRLGWAALIAGLLLIGGSDRTVRAQVTNLACGPIRSSDQTFVKDDTWRRTGVPACGYVYDQYGNAILHPNALDICFDNWNSTCKGCPTSSFQVRHRAMLFGRDPWTPLYYYYVYYGNCPNKCGLPKDGCNGGAGNYYVVQNTGSVWKFRQLHVYHWKNCPDSDGSCSKWASSAVETVLGLLGGTGDADAPHVHADNYENDQRRSTWYDDAGVACKSPAGTIRNVGWPRL